MIFTADQIVAHLIGDYILQSHWMATEKVKQSVAAAVHATCYTLPFLFITQNPGAICIILVSHFFIDRFRLARFVVWLKNGPLRYEEGFEPALMTNTGRPPPGVYPIKAGWEWKPLTATGYQDNVPSWLSVWLLIIADNTIHIVCNGLAIFYF